MKLPDLEEFRKIYNALQDDISREVFKHRLLYALLGDETCNIQMVYQYQPARELLFSKKLCFYGAGVGASRLLKYDVEKRIPFVIDTYKRGTIENRPILSLDEFLKLENYRDYQILITVLFLKPQMEIQAELERHGLRPLLAYFGQQYFDLPELNLRNKYFVDAGAFDGATTETFLRRVENGHAYVFEANPEQFDTIKKRLGNCPSAELFPYGIYDQDGVVRFAVDCDNLVGSKVTEDDGEAVQVRRLDTLLGDRPVTFLKMDIEGSELAALRGAERIIREQRPKLAICVYHKPEDMWEIPGLILRYHPDYKLYLRHYSLWDTETVLYAI